MSQLAGPLLKQVLAVLLYNRRFHRVSRPALDLLASILEALLISICQRTARIAELEGVKTASLPMLAEELLRSTRPIYTDMIEMLEYLAAQPRLDYPSVLEERGLLNGQLQLLLPTKVDPSLIIFQNEAESSIMNEDSDNTNNLDTFV